MKILYLVASDGIFLNMKGGAGTHIRGTIKGFKENEENVITFIQGDFIQRSVHEKANTIPPNKTKKRKPNYIRVLGRDLKTIFKFKKFKKKLEDIIIKEKPDLIYERSCLYAMYGGKLSEKYNIPHFIETSGCLAELHNDAYGLISVRLANLIEKIKLKKADCVITEAESAIEYVRDKYNLKTQQIIAKPLGIENNNNEVSNKELDNLREHYNIDPDDKVIGYVGSFASYHKIENLLPIFDKTQDLKIKFLLVGSGGNYEYIKREVKKRKFSNVILTGYVSHGIDKYFSAMDLGLIPDSEKHMAPIKYYEYGLYKLAPVVPDYTAYQKLLIKGQNGYKFDVNQEGLYSVIKEIDKTDKTKIKRLGLNWNAFVTSNYSWKLVVREVIKKYKSIKNERSSS